MTIKRKRAKPKPAERTMASQADKVLGLRLNRISSLVLPKVLGKQESAKLDGSNSAETMKEAQKVTVKEDSRPKDLLAAASQVRADQCSDEVKDEQRNNSVKELEPSCNQIPVQPDELRWWVQVGIGEFRIRALYDTGASRVFDQPLVWVPEVLAIICSE